MYISYFKTLLINYPIQIPSRRLRVTASQLDLPSQTLLFIVACGRLQLGVAIRLLKALLQVIDN